MTKAELIERIETIIHQDEVAIVVERTNQFTDGHIDGHLKAMQAMKRLAEELD